VAGSVRLLLADGIIGFYCHIANIDGIIGLYCHICHIVFSDGIIRLYCHMVLSDCIVRLIILMVDYVILTDVWMYRKSLSVYID